MGVLNLNAASFARVLGVSDSTVRNYFDAERNTKPGYDVLERLYHSFGTVNMAWLFGGGGEPLLPKVGEAPNSVPTDRKISRSLIVGIQSGGTATQNQGSSANEQALQRELELLRSQLADKERTIQILLNKL